MTRKAPQTLCAALGVAVCLSVPFAAPAQSAPAPSGTAAGAQAGAPRQSGTVKAVTPTDLVLTTAAGQDVAVNLKASTKVLLVDPTTTNVKAAQNGSLADIAAGDKAVVSGTAGDTGSSLNATRVLLLKSGAIAAMHAGEQAAWARSIGGIVKSKDAGTGDLVVANGARSYTVHTSPGTIVRRYANGSVRFQDAQKSSVTEIQPGDQVQARGERSPDGMTLTAQEIVSGSFSNFSGTLTAVDPSAKTVTLKDLATKKMVTVAVTDQSNLRKLPAGFEAGAAGAREGVEGGTPASPRPQTAEGGSAAAGAQPGARGAGRGAAGAGRRLDLSRVIGRLPEEPLSELKPGEAVMIVASNGGSGGTPTAVTLLSGVEQILAASPSGETTLSPWSLNSSSTEGEGGGEGAAGGSGGPGAR